MMDVNNLEKGQQKAMGILRTWKVSSSAIYSVYQRDDLRITGHGTQNRTNSKELFSPADRGLTSSSVKKVKLKHKHKIRHFFFFLSNPLN